MKRKSYGRDAGLTLRMLLTTGLLGLLYVDLRARPAAVPRRRARADARDHHRARVLPVLHLRQARAQGRRREGRQPRGRARAARHGRAPVRDGRPAEAEGRDHGHPGAERVRDRPLAEARRRLRHHRPLGAPRAERGRGRSRPRAVAHREPRRADHDRRELLRDARGAADPLRPLRRACSAAAAAATTTARRSG